MVDVPILDRGQSRRRRTTLLDTSRDGTVQLTDNVTL